MCCLICKYLGIFWLSLCYKFLVQFHFGLKKRHCMTSILFNFLRCVFYFCFIDYAKAFDCVDHKKLWKILKEMGIPDHLTCLLRNLYAGQEATVRTGHGTTDWFQKEKEYVKAVYCHPAYLTSMQSTS